MVNQDGWMASLLLYFTQDLNLVCLCDRNVGLNTTYAIVKVLENVEEDEPLSQTRVDMTQTKTTKKNTSWMCLQKVEGW